MSISNKLDELFAIVEKNLNSNISFANCLLPHVRDRIDAWKYGAYGWTSPVSLMLTASWYKWIYPNQDVCKIWAMDNKKQSISGGFSIRSYDESYTIPLVTKFQLYENFCSPNSGMQGSRALEKNNLRASHSRIDRDSNLGQSVSFDLELFKNILNDINDSTTEQARDIFCYFLEIALKIKIQNEKSKNNLIQVTISDSIKIKKIIFYAINNFKDPQFIRALCIATVKLLIDNVDSLKNYNLSGIEGSKTASDARSGNAGDFWLEDAYKLPIIGFEIKDSSKTIGFDVLGGLASRIRNNPSLKFYCFISAAVEVIKYEDRADKQWDKLLRQYEAMGVIVLSLSYEEFYNLVSLISITNHNFLNDLTNILKITKDLKINTLDSWNTLLQASNS